MFQGIIFDVDGLMVDTERLYVATMHDIARRLGREVTDATLGRMMGRAPLDSIQLFVNEIGVTADAADVLLERQTIMLHKLRTQLAPMPGLFELLDAAAGRFRLGIATGAPRQFLTEILAKLDIANLFTACIASDEVTRGKPDPEIYLRACRQLELAPARCVVLEDSGNGVLAGRAAGCYVIAVPNEHTKLHDFSAADAKMADLLAVRDWILTQPRSGD